MIKLLQVAPNGIWMFPNWGYALMQSPPLHPPVISGQIYMKDPECAETIENQFSDLCGF